MDSLWSHPAVQSGIVPFIVALVVLLVFGKTRPKLTGLAAISAFTVTVGMVMGFSLAPFTSTKKILVMAYLVAAIGLFVDVTANKQEKYRNYLLVTFAAIAVAGLLWVIWPVVSREGSQYSVLNVLGLCSYVAWMVVGISMASGRQEKGSTAVFALAFGTAVVCVLGATVLYGQLAAPFAAATGAWFLYYILASQKGVFPAGFYLTSAVVCAILGAAATVYASLDWNALAIFALIPLTQWIPSKSHRAVWVKLLQSGVTTLIPALAAIGYAIHQSADSGYYG